VVIVESRATQSPTGGVASATQDSTPAPEGDLVKLNGKMKSKNRPVDGDRLF
jgi:hypothetical protein